MQQATQVLVGLCQQGRRLLHALKHEYQILLGIGIDDVLMWVARGYLCTEEGSAAARYTALETLRLFPAGHIRYDQ